MRGLTSLLLHVALLTLAGPHFGELVRTIAGRVRMNENVLHAVIGGIWAAIGPTEGEVVFDDAGSQGDGGYWNSDTQRVVGKTRGNSEGFGQMRNRP